MTTALDTLAEPRTIAPTSQATAVEQARAVAEVAAAVRVAQENPRDMTAAVARMRQACSQQALADRAFYSLPRAGGRVEGSTVHLARALVAAYGNADYGIRELKRDDVAGESEMSAWAWDQETNVRSSRSFIVPHAIMAGKGAEKRRKALTDLGDIANNNNSVAARAVRETIFTILPVWFVVEAEDICRGTLNGAGGDKPMAAQTADMLALYENSFGVTRTQLETYLGLPTAEWTGQTMGALRVLGGELSRGEKRVADEFQTAPVGRPKVTAAEVTEPGDVFVPDPATDAEEAGK
jgi:hypothetical protein